jgi:hypothetical protein
MPDCGFIALLRKKDLPTYKDVIYLNNRFCVKLNFKTKGGRTMDKENDHSISDEVEIAGETLPETVIRTQAELARRERRRRSGGKRQLCGLKQAGRI